MANPEHLAILKKGVEQSNEWRSNNKSVQPDLSGVNLSLAINLSRTNLSYDSLGPANLSEANLREADLSHTNLSRADLSLATLIRADLSDANLTQANLDGANLGQTNLGRANREQAKREKRASSNGDWGADIAGLLTPLTPKTWLFEMSLSTPVVCDPGCNAPQGRDTFER
jgi:uncharacterized protein YjbI with pentapeptide repeats